MSTTHSDNWNALVMWTHENKHPCAWMLHKQYRHVWCAIPDLDAGMWISYDFRGGLPMIRAECGLDYDLASHYEEQGIKVMRVRTGDYNAFSPMMLRSCVAMVKHWLGLRTWALTPWQLFKALERQA